MQCGKQGPMWLDRGSCRGGFQTRPGATDADHEVSQGSAAMHEGRVSNPPLQPTAGRDKRWFAQALDQPQCPSTLVHAIRAYIANNPARWADDPENISRAVPAETGRV